jgi:hypothetical protein
MQQLSETGQFPQAAAIVDRLKAMTIQCGCEQRCECEVQAVCNSTDDANLLGAAFRRV